MDDAGFDALMRAADPTRPVSAQARQELGRMVVLARPRAHRKAALWGGAAVLGLLGLLGGTTAIAAPGVQTVAAPSARQAVPKAPADSDPNAEFEEVEISNCIVFWGKQGNPPGRRHTGGERFA